MTSLLSATGLVSTLPAAAGERKSGRPFGFQAAVRPDFAFVLKRPSGLDGRVGSLIPSRLATLRTLTGDELSLEAIWSTPSLVRPSRINSRSFLIDHLLIVRLYPFGC